MYASNMKMTGRIPEALSGAMADQMFIATFSERKDMDRFYADALAPGDKV